MRVRYPFAIAIINKNKMQFVIFFLYGERELRYPNRFLREK